MTSLYPSGYFILFRDILNHPFIVSSPVAYKWVLITIIDHSAFQQTILYDHGIQITLEVGELMYTDRQLSEWSGVPRSTVQRAVSGFLKSEIVGQKVGHKKSIIKCLFPTTYKQINEQYGPGFGPKVGQEWATKNKLNELNKHKNDVVLSNSHENKEKLEVHDFLKTLPISEGDRQALSRFERERVEFVVKVALHPETKIKTTLIQYLMYHSSPGNPLPKIPISQEDIVNKNKKQANIIYKSWMPPAGVVINFLNKEIEIVKGIHSICLGYKENAFDEQFESLLRKWGFKKSQKIEDIQQANEA